jgi:lipopolysaccharide/colanic/teichoic acid biosynthesis glycosyltransferase
MIVSQFEAEKAARSGNERVLKYSTGCAAQGLPRGFDILASLLGLLLLLPLLMVAALVVMLTSHGGALFRQQRVGRHGEPFVIYKLRTMIVSAVGPHVTKANDIRITRVGRFLRNTKLDELPTLWNVLRGDMALVGPRPEVPRYVNLEDPQWQSVLSTRPGVTDPVTLHLRSEEKLLAEIAGDPEQYYLDDLQPLKLKGYLAYLSVRTWTTDLKVLCQTVAAIIFK